MNGSNSAELDTNALPPVFVNGQGMPLPGSTWPYRPIPSGPTPQVGYISFSPQQAWQCPGCKTHYAPSVQSCRCSSFLLGGTAVMFGHDGSGGSPGSTHPLSRQHNACSCRQTSPAEER